MKLKICGMTDADNIQAVASVQPDYLGFIFHEPSSRYFELDTIPKIPKHIKKTGVFVDKPLDYILDKIQRYKLQAVQLHGNESPEFCNSLGRAPLIDHIEIIKVFSVNSTFNVSVLEPYETVCDYFLFDTKGQLPGGNGYTFDWNLLKNYPSQKPFFLSGGIGLNNVEDLKNFQSYAVSKYCYAIDVNSKFETAPGLKKIDALKMFKLSL